MASLMALVSGITASGILFTGYFTSIGLFARARKERVRFLVWEALILLCLGTFYLGTVVSFFKLFITGSNVEPGYVGAQLCYTIAPIGSAICMYTGFTMLGKEKIAIPMAVIHLLTGLFYWYGLYVQPNITVEAVVPVEIGGGLVDFELLSYVQLLTALYLGFLLAVIGGGFFWFAKQSTGDVRKRFLLTATGSCFFTISGAIDSLVELAYFIVIPRFFMITGAILLYMGFLRGITEAKVKARGKKMKRQEAPVELKAPIMEERPVEKEEVWKPPSPEASREVAKLPEPPQNVGAPPVMSKVTELPTPPQAIQQEPKEIASNPENPPPGSAMPKIALDPKVREMFRTPSPNTPVPTPEPPAPTIMKKCPSCGHELPIRAKFCNNCGAQIEEELIRLA